MRRVQFFPNDELYEKLKQEAEKTGLPMSQLVEDVMSKHFGLIEEDDRLFTEILDDVLQEAEEFVRGIKVGDTFDLLTASSTMRETPMLKGSKTRSTRAALGASFARVVGKPPFANVRRARDRDGRLLYSENNSSLYQKF